MDAARAAIVQKGDRFIFGCRLVAQPIATLSPAPPTGFALRGESLSLVWPRESNQREGHPDIRVWPLRDQTSLAPVLLRGPAYKGHPWPFKPLAASMRLVPLRNTSTRPPDGVRIPSRLEVFCFSIFCFCFCCTHQQTTPSAPFRRVSGIDVEGVERHGCRESRDGPGMALRGVPLERRWSERTLREAQGRMVGQAFLVTFVATDKSDPPSRAEPLRQTARPF